MKRWCVMLALCALFTACKKDGVVLQDCGIVLPIEKTYLEKGVSYQAAGKDQTHIPAVLLVHTNEEKMAALIARAQSYSQTEYIAHFEELQEESTRYRKALALVLVIPDAEYQTYVQENPVPAFGTLVESGILGHKGGNAYWFATYDDGTDGMSQEEAAVYTDCRDYVWQAVKNARFTTIKTTELATDANASDYPTSLPAFKTTDLDGNSVTNDIFAQADVTVLNVWGTFCGPCIAEMPELGAWAKSLSDRAQVVGLVSDVQTADDTDGISEAKAILTSADADFINLIANGDFAPFLQGVQFVPTTFLIDRDGTVIGEPIVGARVSAYKEAVEAYLAQ